MKTSESKKEYVDHPRYGAKPIDSGISINKAQIEIGRWRYSTLKYFPQTAIPADIEKQNYSIFPRSFYVDIEEQCEVCSRHFIFFALEQKYWFEELGFWVDSHCTRCIECRKKDQELKQLHLKYQKLVTKNDRI